MPYDLCRFKVLATTPVGMESVAASFIEESIEGVEVLESPRGFRGLLLVHRATGSAEDLAGEVLRATSHVEKAFPIHECVEASPERIAEAAARQAELRLKRDEKFAVRTVRRGSHPFTSLDVNVRVGAEVQRRTGASVDLESPDKVVLINVLSDVALVSVVDSSQLRGKMLKAKPPFYKFFRRLIIAQEPYLGDERSSYVMGTRVGRGLQNYEVGDYYVALIKPVPAAPLAYFIKGVMDGIKSRYEVQVKSYGRDVHMTRIHVYEMHELVRMLRNHPIIVLEPEGRFVSEVAGELRNLLSRRSRPVLLLGSREGVPGGIYRFASLVIDVAPGITLSTEYALPTALGLLELVLSPESLEVDDVT
ncbi:MAG: SPOUT family RNA methylase [Fervidicoccaceae archaeon]